MRVFSALVLLAVVTMVAVACGDSDPGGTVDGSTTMVTVDLAPISEVSSTTAEAAATTSTTTTRPTSTTTAARTPPTVAPPTVAGGSGGEDTALAGEPFDLHPPSGAVLGVVGVAHDDVLNVREFPGLTAIVARLAPTEDNVVSEGEGRLLSDSIWWKTTAGGATGWVNSRYLAYLGDVEDLTYAVVRDHGVYPTGPNMEVLGRTVAETLASDDPPSSIVMSVAPTSGDLGEVTYDVIGLGDDAQVGWRLHVFGTPEGGGFTLKSVEATALCGRGVTGGVCL